MHSPVAGIDLLFCVVCVLCNVFFIICVALYAVFCLSVMSYFVWYVCFCVLCLIVVSLPPGKIPFAVQLNNNNILNTTCVSHQPHIGLDFKTFHRRTVADILRRDVITNHEQNWYSVPDLRNICGSAAYIYIVPLLMSRNSSCSFKYMICIINEPK
jgi:hypothetical protein